MLMEDVFLLSLVYQSYFVVGLRVIRITANVNNEYSKSSTLLLCCLFSQIYFDKDFMLSFGSMFVLDIFMMSTRLSPPLPHPRMK